MAIEMLPVKTFNGWKRFLESQEGFTLVEMITVVAIMGIILAIAVPNFSKWKEKHQINGQAQKVYFDLVLARTVAVKNNNDVRVTFNLNADTYQVHDDTNGDGLEDSGEALKTINLEENVQFAYITGIPDIDDNTVTSAVSFGGDGSQTVTFDSRGQASASGSVFMLHSSDIGTTSSRARSISVLQATGAVDYWSYDATLIPLPPWK